MPNAKGSRRKRDRDWGVVTVDTQTDFTGTTRHQLNELMRDRMGKLQAELAHIDRLKKYWAAADTRARQDLRKEHTIEAVRMNKEAKSNLYRLGNREVQLLKVLPALSMELDRQEARVGREEKAGVRDAPKPLPELDPLTKKLLAQEQSGP